MITVFIRHEVKDYDSWKSGYDDTEGLRQENNVVNATVHCEKDNPNMVIVTHQFNTPDDAVKFLNLEGLGEAMAAAGVVGEPDIWITEDM